jgi:hypothetical protein
MISLMKLRVTLKRTGNVVEFLKTMRVGFRSLMSRRQRQRCLVVWRL